VRKEGRGKEQESRGREIGDEKDNPRIGGGSRMEENKNWWQGEGGWKVGMEEDEEGKEGSYLCLVVIKEAINSVNQCGSKITISDSCGSEGK
jgi:hypothetical protein